MTDYVDGGRSLTDPTHYYVTAFNAAGESDPSNEACARSVLVLAILLGC